MLFTTKSPLSLAQDECSQPCKDGCFEAVVEDCITFGNLGDPQPGDGCAEVYSNQMVGIDQPALNLTACPNLEADDDFLNCFYVGACLVNCGILEYENVEGPCSVDAFGALCGQCQDDCLVVGGLDPFVDDIILNATDTCYSCIDVAVNVLVDCVFNCFSVQGGDCEEACNLACVDIDEATLDEYEKVTVGWELAGINYMAENRIQPNTRFEYLFVRSIDDLVEEASQGDIALLVGGFLLMFAYRCVYMCGCVLLTVLQ